MPSTSPLPPRAPLRRRVVHWVDRVAVGSDPVARARVRVQHLVVVLSAIVGVPYVSMLLLAGKGVAAVLAGIIVLMSVGALLLLSRRGRPLLGGQVIGMSFFLVIATVLVMRGGLHSNSAIWLVMVPVIGGMAVEAWFGLVLGGLAALFLGALWALHTAGVSMGESLPDDIAWLFVLVDHVTVPFSIGALLWSQSGVWTRLVRTLDRTNARLRVEVSERKRAEEVALGAARARTTFLATMSHEIRTPLNGVLGITDVMLDGALSAEQRELANVVQRSGEQLRTLLDDVLDFSKIDSGKLELAERPTNLRALGRELQELWKARAVERGLGLVVDVDAAVPDWVMLDDHRLRQILGNLVSNAIKFTPAGEVRLAVRTREDWLWVEVHDTGTGIPADALAAIFEPFQQVDQSDAREHGGTGLGLAICRRLAQRMGGTITAESELDRGTCFRVQLPNVVARAPVPSDDTSGPRRDLTGRHILVVEDNPVNQLVMRAMLERAGARVRLAGDGLEGVNLVAEELPDVVLMDCQMPVCDGYMATEELRSRGVTVPIVAVTANAMADDRQRCLDSGMDDHLGKPVRLEELMTVLGRWLPDVVERSSA